MKREKIIGYGILVILILWFSVVFWFAKNSKYSTYYRLKDLENRVDYLEKKGGLNELPETTTEEKKEKER